MSNSPTQAAEKLSPDWLANLILVRWSAGRTRLGLKIERAPRLNLLLALLLVICGIGMALAWTPPPYNDTNFDLRDFGILHRLGVRGPIILGWIVAASGFIALFPARQMRILAVTGVAMLLNLLIASELLESGGGAQALIPLTISMIGPSLGFIFYLRRRDRFGFALMIAALPLSYLAAAYLVQGNKLHHVNSFTANPRMFMVLWLYAAEVRAGASSIAPFSSQFWAYVFSPAQLMNSLCMPTLKFTRAKCHWESVILGFEVILACLFYMFALSFIEAKLNEDFRRLTSLSSVSGYGVLNYLRTYAYSFAAISSAEGCFRILGFDVNAMFRVPLLAANPHERWQRWSVMFYDFLKSLVFVPLLRRYRSAFFAVVVTFVVSAVIHEVPYALSWRWDDIFEANARRTVGHIAFFTLHGLAVYASLKLSHRLPAGATRRGWYGVAATFVVMAIIHVLAP